jgi:hypothetical protein
MANAILERQRELTKKVDLCREHGLRDIKYFAGKYNECLNRPFSMLATLLHLGVSRLVYAKSSLFGAKPTARSRGVNQSGKAMFDNCRTWKQGRGNQANQH